MSTPYINKCANCELIVPESDLKVIKDLFQRVMPGDTMPSGECPACGALCFHIELKPQLVEIHVRQMVPNEDLDHNDRQAKVAGRYEVEVPGDVTPDIAVSIALDDFYSSTAIRCLDHFDITCMIEGKVVGPSDHDSYSHTGESLSDVIKIEDYPWDGPRYSVYIQIPVGVRINSIIAESPEKAIDVAFDLVYSERSRFCHNTKTEPVSDIEKFWGANTFVEYSELAEDGLVCALVDEFGDYEYVKSKWYEPHPVKGSNEVLPMGHTEKQISEAIQKALDALMNVPCVSETYDQQHSDTQTDAYQELKDVFENLFPSPS